MQHIAKMLHCNAKISNEIKKKKQAVESLANGQILPNNHTSATHFPANSQGYITFVNFLKRNN